MTGERIVGRRAVGAEPTSPLLTLLRAGDRLLAAEFERASAIRHATTKGSLRERAVFPIARQLFPARYEVTSGEIMNASGQRSRAQDVIVYSPDVVAGWQIDQIGALLPAEAVVATIEVKSRASKADIDTATTNLASMKAVFGDRPRDGLAGDLVIDHTVDRPLGLALFYAPTTSWKSFLKNVSRSVQATEVDLRPDFYLLPGVGAVTWPPDDHGKPLRGRAQGDEVLVMEGADTMLALVYVISSHLRTWVSPQLNVWDYARGQSEGLDLTVSRRPLP